MEKYYFMGAVIVLILLLLLVGINRDKGIITQDNEEFSATIRDGNVILVDVRTPAEWSEGHIPGAINIDIFSADFSRKAKELLPQEKEVAVYCKGGGRSKKAARRLIKMGYTVYNLKGGITQWNGDVVIPNN